ncbi:MAG: DNA polymerase IV [Clostridium sp.]|uniref:Y-family DNA polymerase n=1 Tax=Clostridium sp. TaxID=1506 RepID=UPI002FCAB7AE
MDKNVIFHCDVNNAYLSWQSAYGVLNNGDIDYRDIPSVIGGSESKRHGIVLAKSTPAKKMGIKTGETLFSARKKCRDLVVIPPRYDIYVKCSKAMIDVLSEYTPCIERTSIDECFLDFSGMDYLYSDYIKLAKAIQSRIYSELGFTINIGISTNKLLAKMASDFEKPNKIHTLWPEEVETKMWPLPIGKLYMVGKSSQRKLLGINIQTIGDLANADKDIITRLLKGNGDKLYRYSRGIEDSKVISEEIEAKGIGNSTTMSFDVTDRHTAHMVLLSLCENVGMRLRREGKLCSTISINIKESSFISYSKQKKSISPIDSTKRIYEEAIYLFDILWKGNPIRHLGVQVTDLTSEESAQLSLFDSLSSNKNKALDITIDAIRNKYGNTSLVRSAFINSGLKSIAGGVSDDDYPKIQTTM